MNDKPEIIVFDMEGTIFKKNFKGPNGHSRGNAWEIFSDNTGEQGTEFREKMYKKWKNNEISFIEWCERTAQKYKKEGLKKEFFEETIKKIPYQTGFEKAINEIHNNNIKTAIVTGGIKHQARRVQSQYNIDYIFATTEFYWDEDNTISDWNILPFGHHGKITAINLLAESQGIETEDIGFVCDGHNDIPVAKFINGKTISIDGTDKLKSVTDYNLSMDKNTFTDVSKIFLK